MVLKWFFCGGWCWLTGLVAANVLAVPQWLEERQLVVAGRVVKMAAVC